MFCPQTVKWVYNYNFVIVKKKNQISFLLQSDYQNLSVASHGGCLEFIHVGIFRISVNDINH